ncbi:MAG: hypothetical protein DMG32_13315 [Acidobacteria bacterium]|nr:MAG: hypothetical protein DMG32_13315 [Acidobacteriota bacterium]
MVRQQVAQAIRPRATAWPGVSTSALRPWRHRSWIFPRDQDLAAKAGTFTRKDLTTLLAKIENKRLASAA